MSARPPDERIFLTQKNGTDIYVQVTESPWLLDVDAFTIPIGREFYEDVGLAKGFLDYINEKSKDFIEKIESLISRVYGDNNFSASSPLLIELPQELREIKASHVFIASVEDEEGGNINLAQEMANLIVRNSNENSLFKIAISVPESRTSHQSIEAIIEPMLVGIFLAIANNNSIKEITLTTLEDPAVETLKGVAKDIQEAWEEEPTSPEKQEAPSSKKKYSEPIQKEPEEQEESSYPEELLEAMENLSPSGKRVLQFAGYFARESNSGLIDSKMILDSLILLKNKEAANDRVSKTTKFLHKFLIENSNKEELDFDPYSLIPFEIENSIKNVSQWGHELPEPESFDDEGKEVLIKSFQIARETEKETDGVIHLRPLLAAILTAPPPVRALDHLRTLGYEIGELQKQFHRLIKNKYTEDDLEAWEKILKGEGGGKEKLLPLGRAVSQRDEPGDVDLLGDENLVRALAAMIADPNQGTPFTIGLLGEWGTGKSTVMNLLRKRLDAEEPDRFIFAEFNAWEYERTKNLPAGLAQEVVQAFVDKSSWWDNFKLRIEFAMREHGIGALRIGFYAFIAIGVPWLIFYLLGIIGLPLPDIDKALGFGAVGGLAGAGVYLWRSLKQIVEHPLSVKLRTYLKLPTYGEHLGLIPVLKRHIETLCEIRLDNWQWRTEKRKTALGVLSKLFDESVSNYSYTGEYETKKRLIVFIDDLDRCDPPSISSMLDAIRLVMDLEHVITIIGIDYRIAYRAVGDHYKNLEGGGRTKEQIARDYLGKIIQMPILLHKPTEADLTSFVEKALFPGAWEPDKDEKDSEKKTDDVETGKEPPEEIETIKPEGEKAAEEMVPITVKKVASKKKEAVVSEPEKAEDSSERPPIPSERPAIIDGTKKGVEKGEDPLEKEMVFTVSESERFGRLAFDFDLRNPRQLRRLRNSYGLLKLIYSMGANIGFKDVNLPEENDDVHWQLMTLLFWKEFKFENLDLAEEVLKKLSFGKITMELDKISEIVSLPERVVAHLSYAGLGELGSHNGKLVDLENFVERFVLPQKIEKIVSVLEEVINTEETVEKETEAKKAKPKVKAKARTKK